MVQHRQPAANACWDEPWNRSHGVNSRPSCPSRRQVKVNATFVASLSIKRKLIILHFSPSRFSSELAQTSSTAQITKCEKSVGKHGRKKAAHVRLENGVLLFANWRARRKTKEGEDVRDWNRRNSEPEDGWVYLANLMEAVRFLQPQ